MKKLCLALAFLLLAPLALAQAPECLYQDNLSGPATGGEGSGGGDGTYIDLYGNNFSGASVTVNGTAVAQIIYNGTDPTGNRSQLGVQVSRSTTGTGAIQVTTSGGTCQYSTATVSGCSISSGVATFSYTGSQLLAGQLIYLDNLSVSDTVCGALQARNYTVLSTGLTSSQFEISTPTAANSSFVSDSGTAGNGGFTVASGHIYYIGPTQITGTSYYPGSSSTSCSAILGGTAGSANYGAGTSSSPFLLTGMVDYATPYTLQLVNGGTGYSTGVQSATGGSGTTQPTVDILTVSGGVITSLQGSSAGVGNKVGDILSIAGGTGGTAEIVGYQDEAYSYYGTGVSSPIGQFTPFTYFKCLSPGDTLVFLNGVDFAYGDGTYPGNQGNALTIQTASGTSGSPITIMARPGAIAQLGDSSVPGVNGGIKGAGTSNYINIYGMHASGSFSSGTAILAESSTNPPNMRVVGNVAQCPMCTSGSDVIGGGWGLLEEVTANQTHNKFLGNWVYNGGTFQPGSLGTVPSKEFQCYYFNGNGMEAGWNRAGNYAGYSNNPSTASCGNYGMQMNYYNDGGTVGYGDFSFHDNDFCCTNGAALNPDTIDPTQGPINLYNNVAHHVGIQPGIDGAGSFSGLVLAGYGPVSSTGAVNAYNNTFFDSSVILGTSNLYTGCAVQVCNQICGYVTQGQVQLNFTNNIVVQPTYTYQGSNNVLVCGNGTTALSYTLTSAAAASGGTTTYSGTITGGGATGDYFNLTAAAPSGSNTVYTCSTNSCYQFIGATAGYYNGWPIVITGFTNTPNNAAYGTYSIVSYTTGSPSTITVNNPNGVTESNPSGKISLSAFAGTQYVVAGNSGSNCNGQFQATGSTSGTLILQNPSCAGGTGGTATAWLAITGSNNLFYVASGANAAPQNGLTSFTPPTNPSFTAQSLPVSSPVSAGSWTNYNIQSGSSAKAAGTTNYEAPLDFTGYVRPSTPAIGFVEYQSGSSYTLYTSVVGSGTLVCTPSGSIASGTSVSCTATAGTGYTFSSFSTNTCGFTASSNTISGTMPSNSCSLAATNTVNSYTLTVTSPTHGTITGSGCATGSVPYGTSITCQANPATGYSFGGWSGGTLSGTTNPQTFLMGAGAATVTAGFSLPTALLGVL